MSEEVFILVLEDPDVVSSEAIHKRLVTFLRVNSFILDQIQIPAGPNRYNIGPMPYTPEELQDFTTLYQ